MNSLSLADLASEQLTLAKTATSGRSAHTVHGGHEHDLRQTVIALAAIPSIAAKVNPLPVITW